MKGPKPRNINERFDEKVDRSGSCWIWKASKNQYGYGTFYWRPDKPGYLAHRFSYEREYGRVYPDLDVCHRCDNPACVRPTHLFVGTAKDNLQDSKAKGRNNRGSRNGRAKLTEVEVSRIRALAHLPRKKLAKMFDIGECNLSDILNRKIWTHI